MLRPRHRVKSNLLWKMLGIALLANLFLWPLLIYLGAFRGVRQELIPVTLVARPPSSKAPTVVSKVPPPAPVIPAPKPVLMAKAPPPSRPSMAAVTPKPPVPAAVKTVARPAPRRIVRTHRRAHRVLMAKAATLNRNPERAASWLTGFPAPTKPPRKPVERIAKRPSLPAVKTPQPSSAPDKTVVLPSEGSTPHLQPAVAVVKTQPSIPESMQNSAWHSTFRGQFVVAKNGHVMPQMVSSTGSHVLDARALKAAKHWKFRPATRNGVPVASTVKFEIEYAVRAVP